MGITPAPDGDNDAEHSSREYTKDNTGNKQVTDGYTRKQAVKDKGDAGGYDGTEERASTDAPGGEALIIFVLIHFRQGYSPHGSCGREAVADNGGKAGTGSHGSYPQASPKVPKPSVGGIIKVGAESGIEAEETNQYEEVHR